MYFRSNDGSKNTFPHQATLDPLRLKKGKNTNYAFGWK